MTNPTGAPTAEWRAEYERLRDLYGVPFLLTRAMLTMLLQDVSLAHQQALEIDRVYRAPPAVPRSPLLDRDVLRRVMLIGYWETFPRGSAHPNGPDVPEFAIDRALNEVVRPAMGVAPDSDVSGSDTGAVDLAASVVSLDSEQGALGNAQRPDGDGDTSKATALFDAIILHGRLEDEMCDLLLRAAGHDPDEFPWPISDITFDWYDGSFEFIGARNDWVQPDGALEAWRALGFDRCWINYADNTEVPIMLVPGEHAGVYARRPRRCATQTSASNTSVGCATNAEDIESVDHQSTGAGVGTSTNEVNP